MRIIEPSGRMAMSQMLTAGRPVPNLAQVAAAVGGPVEPDVGSRVESLRVAGVDLQDVDGKRREAGFDRRESPTGVCRL